MKKNKVMRLAAILMVVCLVATCAICGTLAKYATSIGDNEAARVAKWGIDAGDVSLEGLFATGKTAEVVALDRIAPGTSGEKEFTVSGEGTPEVSYKVDGHAYWMNTPSGDARALNDHVKFTLKKGTQTIIGPLTGEEFDTAFRDYIGVGQEFDAGTAFKLAGTFTLSWDWPMGESDDPHDDYNEADTALGNLSATENPYSNSFELTLKVIQTTM